MNYNTNPSSITTTDTTVPTNFTIPYTLNDSHENLHTDRCLCRQENIHKISEDINSPNMISHDLSNLSLEKFPIFPNPCNISSLTISNNNLRELSDNMTLLKNLTRLSANNNKITEITRNITKLKKLKWLDLTKNELHELPKSLNLHNLNLVGLGLSDNKFKKIPETVLKLKMLKKFGFFNNYLKILPSNLCRMTTITKLDLSSNKLTSIPKSITNLKNLTWLNLSNNNLKELPDLSPLTKLEELGLSNNQLEYLPFMNLKNVKILPIYKNNLKNVALILPKVLKLDLSDNLLENVDLYLPNCTYLTLRNNNFKQKNINNFNKLNIFAFNLEILDLRDNSLKYLSNKFLNSIKKIKNLKLKNNNFKKNNLNNALHENLNQLTLSEKLINNYLCNYNKNKNIVNVRNNYKKLLNLVEQKVNYINFNLKLTVDSTIRKENIDELMKNYYNVICNNLTGKNFNTFKKYNGIGDDIKINEIYKYLFLEMLSIKNIENIKIKQPLKNNRINFYTAIFKILGFDFDFNYYARNEQLINLNICDSCKMFYVGEGRKILCNVDTETFSRNNNRSRKSYINMSPNNINTNDSISYKNNNQSNSYYGSFNNISDENIFYVIEKTVCYSENCYNQYCYYN